MPINTSIEKNMILKIKGIKSAPCFLLFLTKTSVLVESMFLTSEQSTANKVKVYLKQGS